MHIARFLAACKYTAQHAGGHLLHVYIEQEAKDLIRVLIRALRMDGLPGAGRIIRSMDPRVRRKLIHLLLGHWTMPLAALNVSLNTYMRHGDAE